jgi:hypothetical protein
VIACRGIDIVQGAANLVGLIVGPRRVLVEDSADTDCSEHAALDGTQRSLS